MKLGGKDHLVGVLTCTDEDDVLLAAHGGKCIRFPVTDVRVFTGRTSRGVRGIKLAKGDEVISMSILCHTEIDVAHRRAYFRQSGEHAEQMAPEETVAEETAVEVTLPDERVAELAAAEQFILSVTENGFGKRTSAYDYRITRRGGSGIANIATTERNGPVIASFPVKDTDQLMLVTDGGQIIRCTVADIRVAGRKTQGVTIFKVAEGERVVSVARLEENGTMSHEPEGDVQPLVTEGGGSDG
jgi:DNA gyrase subunit A